MASVSPPSARPAQKSQVTTLPPKPAARSRTGLSLTWVAGPGEWLLPYVSIWLGREGTRRGLSCLIHEPSPLSPSAGQLLGVHATGHAPPPLIRAIRKREVHVRTSDGVNYLCLGRTPTEAMGIGDPRIRELLAAGVVRLEQQMDLHQMLMAPGQPLPLRWVDRLGPVCLLVSPSPARLLEGYSLLKSLWVRRPDLPVQFVVGGPCMRVEVEAARRFLTRVSLRFLGRSPEFAGSIMGDSHSYDGPRFDGGLPLTVHDGKVRVADPAEPVRKEIAALLDKLLDRPGAASDTVAGRQRVLLTPLLVDTAAAGMERPSAA